jgi:hypothetical protein
MSDKCIPEYVVNRWLELAEETQYDYLQLQGEHQQQNCGDESHSVLASVLTEDEVVFADAVAYSIETKGEPSVDVDTPDVQPVFLAAQSLRGHEGLGL